MQSNTVSHWLGVKLQSALILYLQASYYSNRIDKRACYFCNRHANLILMKTWYFPDHDGSDSADNNFDGIFLTKCHRFWENNVFDAVAWWTYPDLKDDEAPNCDKQSFKPTINSSTHPEVEIRKYFHYFWGRFYTLLKIIPYSGIKIIISLFSIYQLHFVANKAIVSLDIRNALQSLHNIFYQP